MRGLRGLFGFDDLSGVPYPAGLGDVDGVILDTNDAFCRLVGRERSEMVGARWATLMHPDDAAAALEALRDLRSSGRVPSPVRRRLLRADGRVVWVDVSLMPIRRDGALQATVAFMQDVTALVSTTERLDRALDLAADGLWEWDVESQRVTASRPLHAMIGLPADAPFPDAVEWQAMIHPDDAPRVHGAFERLMTGDGTFDCEYRLRTARGEIRIRDRARVMARDAAGQPIRLLGVVTDVTAQHAAIEAAWHGQRIDALGKLASGVAHDINNLLTAIGGNAALLDRVVTGKASSLVSDIGLAVKAASNLTRNLLAFSRRQGGSPESVSMSEHVDGTVRLLRRLLGDSLELRAEVRTSEARVLIDPSHMDQILINLVVNARDAMPRGGEVSIEVDTIDVTAPPTAAWPRSSAGDHVRLAVSDHGVGMTDEVKARLFEPFFTTKPRGSGTGLGLSTVYSVVEQHGGFIDVDSSPGHGTTFRVYLPCSVGTPTARTAPTLEWVRGQERVVLVDDDRLVREMLERTLALLGYEVAVFASGDDCLRSIDRVSAADLLITDVVMPGISGFELARRVRDAAPDLPILLITAHPHDEGNADEDRFPVLAKPFAPSELARRIRTVLA